MQFVRDLYNYNMGGEYIPESDIVFLYVFSVQNNFLFHG